MTTTITTTDPIQFQCLSTTLNNIGALHYESGRNESALEYLEEAANTRTFAINNSRPFTERDAYRHREARRDEDHLLQSITEIRRDVVGIPLFSSYRRQRGQQPPCYDKCYFSQAILLDDDDDDVGNNVNALPAAVTMFNMGLVLRSMSLLDMAMSVFQLAQHEVSPDEYPLLTSAILANIATIHHMEDRDDDALQIFSEVVGLYENEVVNTDAISDSAALEQIQRCVGATLSSMAMICFRRGKFNDALDLCQDTGKILTPSERESHDVLINMYNESLILHEKGDCEAAFEHCQLVISSVTDGRQANHALVGAAWHTMGEIQLEMGYLDDAMISLKQSIKHKKCVYGNCHLDIADIYYDWGCVMTNLGKYLDALSFFKMERDILERLLGNDHMEMIIANCNIAGTYHLMGDLDMALGTYKDALQIAEAASKDNCRDVEVGKIMSTIATIYLEKGDISSANKLFLQVSTISSQIDPEHYNFSSYSFFGQINLCFGLESFPAAPTA